VPLARAGYRVTGVDRSAALLEEARRRAGGERWPKLVRADYRQLPFPDASFDAAVNLFTSLGYLGEEEDTRVLSEIGRVLRPGGRLVIESMHRDRLVLHWSEQDWRLVGEGRLLLEQRTFDALSGVAQTTQTVIDGAGERESRSYSVRVYAASELLAMLERAGFAEIKAYGDLEGGPFAPSTRLVIVARR
jgi:ubiquinone/menaquinone biosynthesis C-methylase UbiE